jgi:luciferase family oxidoreductase group 1
VTSLRLSVLDRSPSRQGGGHARALRDTVRFAREVEALGYHRFWVSEHHGVPGISGSAPTVLAAAVASATSRIRVGTGGVMLPNHRPLIVAEQFGVLESLFPGRIDMGLGRSVGFTEPVRRALGHGKEDADGFGAQVSELLGYFTGRQDSVRAVPSEGLRVPAFLLATGSGAGLAAELGLPLVIAAVRGEQTMIDAISRYREEFVPSVLSPEPYVVVSSAIAVADTDEQARRMLLSEAWSTVYSRTHGVFPPLLPPEDVLARTMTERESRLLGSSLAGQIHGTDAEVSTALDGLVRRTGADEILVTTSVFDQAARLDSYHRLARLAGIAVAPDFVAG